jgi:hypothetical protein
MALTKAKTFKAHALAHKALEIDSPSPKALGVPFLNLKEVAFIPITNLLVGLREGRATPSRVNLWHFVFNHINLSNWIQKRQTSLWKFQTSLLISFLVLIQFVLRGRNSIYDKPAYLKRQV